MLSSIKALEICRRGSYAYVLRNYTLSSITRAKRTINKEIGWYMK